MGSVAIVSEIFGVILGEPMDSERSLEEIIALLGDK
jgi:hypothetical protein